MTNSEVGESPLNYNHEAREISKHLRPVMFLEPTTIDKACLVSTPKLPFATPYPNGPLNTDLAVDAQRKPHEVIEIDPMGGTDEQEMQKLKRRQHNRECSKKSILRRKHEHEELHAKIKAISRETTMLTGKIIKHSEEINDLRTENKTLLEELRNVCDRETISRLESMNPENSGQDQQASYVSDQNTDTSPSSDLSGIVNSSLE